MAKDNVELGSFDLMGIPAAPRGMPKIEVTFDIDANGIVHVNAKDVGTGKEQSIKITAPKKLSKEEIDRMVKEAEKFASEDTKKKEEVEVVNQADNLVYSTEKSLKDYGDKVSQQDRANIESGLNDLKQAIKDKNVDRIKKSMESLQQASYKLAEEIYKSSQQKGQPGAGPQAGPEQPQGGPTGGPETGPEQGPGKKDDIIDADFRAEDEDKDKKKK
jgi:molecular chaperone DnaK